MSNEVKKLPRPTADVISEYESVVSIYSSFDPSWSDEANIYLNKAAELEDNYDWSNIEFTDPATGKKGLKSIRGEMVVSAQYDSFPSPCSYILNRWEPIIAVRDGKYGLLSGKGDEEVYVPFEYDHISPVPDDLKYIGRKDDSGENIIVFDYSDDGCYL